MIINTLVTIETMYSVEEYLMPIDFLKPFDSQVDKFLSNIAFCEDYVIAQYMPVSPEYMAKRQELICEYEKRNHESIEFAFPSGNYTSLDTLKFDLSLEE